MTTGRLGYNSVNDRYGLLVSDLWEHSGFHCGEGLEAMVDGKWQMCTYMCVASVVVIPKKPSAHERPRRAPSFDV